MVHHSDPNQAPSQETPGETVRIQLDDVVADVNPQGAFIERFAVASSDGSFHDILFPYDATAEKPRGTHLCLPNFGPDITGTLDQHGFARTVAWEVMGSSADELKMQYRHAEGSYAGLAAELRLRVNPREQFEDEFDEAGKKLSGGALVLDLMLLNDGEQPMRVAPAVHNYFALPEGVNPEEVAVNGIIYDRESLEAATTELWPTDKEGIPGPVEIEFPEHRVIMHSSNFRNYTAWTNFGGPYICVEPSAAGPSFLKAQGGEDEYLAVGGVKLYRAVIEAELNN